MAHDSLFRVPLAALRDASLTPAQRGSRVERPGPKLSSDGLSMDAQGHLLITAAEHGSALRWRADTRQLQTLIQWPRIRSGGGLIHDPHGWLYLADCAIHEQMLRSKAHIVSQGPYTIWL